MSVSFIIYYLLGIPILILISILLKKYLFRTWHILGVLVVSFVFLQLLPLPRSAIPYAAVTHESDEPAAIGFGFPASVVKIYLDEGCVLFGKPCYSSSVNPFVWNGFMFDASDEYKNHIYPGDMMLVGNMKWNLTLSLPLVVISAIVLLVLYRKDKRIISKSKSGKLKERIGRTAFIVAIVPIIYIWFARDIAMFGWKPCVEKYSPTYVPEGLSINKTVDPNISKKPCGQQFVIYEGEGWVILEMNIKYGFERNNIDPNKIEFTTLSDRKYAIVNPTRPDDPQNYTQNPEDTSTNETRQLYGVIGDTFVSISNTFHEEQPLALEEKIKIFEALQK